MALLGAALASCRPQRSPSATPSPSASPGGAGRGPAPSRTPTPGDQSNAIGDAQQPPESGRLSARPGEAALPGDAALPAAALGLQPLDLAPDRDGLRLVPAGYSPDRPAPMVVVLHGAGGTAEQGMALLQGLAEEAGVILVAPASRGRTWDVVLGGFGPDVEYIEQALRQTFERYAVDPARVAVSGFSDGASYALSLGLANGELFSAVLAFSPGFSAPEDEQGRPRVFVSHGTADQVLPIDRTSRRIVPRLRANGYDVRYEEFAGPHVVPPEIAAEALSWFLDGPD